MRLILNGGHGVFSDGNSWFCNPTISYVAQDLPWPPASPTAYPAIVALSLLWQRLAGTIVVSGPAAVAILSLVAVLVGGAELQASGPFTPTVSGFRLASLKHGAR